MNKKQLTGFYDRNKREISVNDNIAINIYDACQRPMPLIISKNCIVEVRDGKFGVIWGLKKEFTLLSDFSWNVIFEIKKTQENRNEANQ